MSRTIQRLVFALAIPIATLCVPPALAQGTLTASVGVEVTIISPLSLTVTQKLDFGRMFAASSRVIAPTAPAAGRFEVNGQGGSDLLITLQMPTVVTGSGSSIPVNGWNYLMSESATFNGATPVTFNGGQVIPINATLSGTTGTTRMYFALGATAQSLVGQATGRYTGTGTITAVYADL